MSKVSAKINFLVAINKDGKNGYINPFWNDRYSEAIVYADHSRFYTEELQFLYDMIGFDKITMMIYIESMNYYKSHKLDNGATFSIRRIEFDIDDDILLYFKLKHQNFFDLYKIIEIIE